MKKSSILLAMLMTANVWAISLETEIIDNKTYYQIGSCEDLKEFASYVNERKTTDYVDHATSGLDKTFYQDRLSANAVLTNDIDCSGEAYTPIAGKFISNSSPKDSIYNMYRGTFDGQGHVISNLTSRQSGEVRANLGLIGYLDSAGVVKNVIIQNPDLVSDAGTSNNDFVGGIAGLSYGTISKCTVVGNASIISSHRNAGGIVGRGFPPAVIEDCLSSVKVEVTGTQNQYAGGLIGLAVDVDGKSVIIRNSVYIGSSVSCTRTNSYSGNQCHAHEAIGGDNVTVDNSCYFDSEVSVSGNGIASYTGSENCEESSNLNDESTVCKLNGGTWSDSQCNGGDGLWLINGTLTNQENFSTDPDGNLYFAISFNANGGEFAENAKTKKMVKEGESIDASDIGEPTRTGYKFKGWAATNDATTPLTSLGSATTTTTFYAVWSVITYHITYMDGADVIASSLLGENSPTEFMINSSDITLVDAKMKILNGGSEGYIFEGWYSESELQNKVTIIPTGSHADVMLYAKYTRAYLVTYFVDNSRDKFVWFLPGATGLGDYTPTSADYTFSGWKSWFHYVDGQAVYLDAQPTVMPEHDLVFEGYLTLGAKVIFDANGGNFGTALYTEYRKNVILYSDITLDDVPDVKRANYEFLGWAKTNDATEPLAGFDQPTTQSDIIFYAVWKGQEYNITYEDLGDMASNNAAAYTYNVVYTLANPQDSTGFTFAGWYDAEDNPVTTIAAGSTGDKTFYAKWKKNITVTITGHSSSNPYNGADQTVEGYDVSVPEGSGYDVLNVSLSSSGAASATGKVAGEYTMGLTAADFTNLDGDNFVVTFDVTDGKLTITKATVNEVGVTLADWSYGSANVPNPVVTGLGAETATFLYAEVGDTSSADSWKSTVPTDIGNYYVKATIPETGNYVGGSAVATFEIAAKSAENLVVTVTPSSGDYNSFSQFPSIVVKDGGTVLEEGVDYTVSITKGDVSTEEMKDAGTYTITVTGKGVYDGSVQGTYTIAQSTEAVYVGLDGWTYGDETPPAPVVTPSYVDEGSVVVEYAKKAGDVDTSNAANWSTTLPKNAGDYYVRATVSETANYAGGSATSEFTIEQREVVIAWSETNPTYTGEALSPTATVTNLVGSDVCNVTVSGSATNVGEGTVTARASALDNPNYKLPATAPSTEFSVAPKNASGFEVTVTPSDFTYTGSAVNPTIVVKDGDKTLSVGTDYTVSGAENISEVGEHVVTITGAGNYNESTTVKFTVSPVVTVTLASDESLVCEGDKGAACNEAQDNIVHVYGVATNELPDASKSGWEFQGWYDSVTGDEVTSIAADRTAELNLVPKFAKDSTFEYEVDGEKKTVTVEVVYGETAGQIITKIVAALDDAVPTKEQTATTDYTYAGTWEVVDGKIVPMFDESAREYTVTLNVPDGATVSPSMTKYAAGTATNLPSANLDGWTFVGWVDGSGNSVTQIAVDATGDKAYTAVFTKDITVVYGEGAGDKLAVEIKLDDSEAEIIAKIEDALEAAGVTPTKSPDADSSYEFNGKWDVDGNTFTAEFEGTVKTETVIVKYGDGAEDLIEVIVPKAANDSVRTAVVMDSLQSKGITPTKSPDADSTYEFNGKWDVDGNTFTAEFEGTVKTETVIVKYGDGAEDLIEVIVPKAANDSVRTAVVMDSLQSKGITPTKSPDADSTYEFNGKWDVDGNTFTAEFEGSPKYIEVVVGDDTVKVVIPDTTSGTGSADSIIVKVKVVVDSDTIMVPVIDGDILDSAAKKILDCIPTKDDSADSTYEFAGWEPIKDSTGKPVVDENGNEIYEPVFKREVKKDSILVAAGDGRTVEVLIYVTDGNAEIQKKIIDTFNDSGIPLPQKDNENDTLYKLNEFVLNVENGIYEPIFKQVIFYPVAFVMPKDGMLLSEFDGYVYGERTVLPEACIKSDSDWEFKGWYTERDGLGTRVRMMLETDRGKKTFYPLFQKTIYYSINGINGEIEVIYTDNAEKNIVRALDRVIPEDYRKNSVNYTFDKWVLENGTYVAKFVEGQGIHSNVLANVHIEVVGHVLEVTGVVSGSKVLVYDARGRLVQSAITGAGSLHMNVQNPGRYIVRVDNWTMPVNVH